MGKACLYIRVSTDEQVQRGYSLREQEGTLLKWAKSEGYELTETVRDDGYSGASPDRPGLRRLVELAEAGKIDTVLVTARDRFFRDSFQRLVMDHTLAEHGVKVRAMNDMEHRVGNTILDAFAEMDRENITNRLMRGKRQKAREGKIVAGRLPVYGFRFSANREAYEVYESQMAAVRRAFELASEGTSLYGIAKILGEEGYVPHSGRKWQRSAIKAMILDDTYATRTVDELRHHLTPEVADRLDPEKRYGVWWYNRRRRVKTKGGYKHEYRPREEWIAVPVPDSGIPPEHVRLARESVAENRRNTRKTSREWELSQGILRCGHCGSALYYALMGSTDSRPSRREKRPYYYCGTPQKRGTDESEGGCAMGRYFSAAKIEGEVWRLVRDTILSPDRLEAVLSRIGDEEPENDGRELLTAKARLDELAKRRSGYIDLAADGVMDREELAGKLSVLNEETAKLKARADELQSDRAKLEEIRRDSKRTLEAMKSVAPEYFDSLPPAERRRLYKTLDLRVHAYKTGPGRGAENTELRVAWMVDSASLTSNQEEEVCRVNGGTSRRYLSNSAHRNPTSEPKPGALRYVITLRGGTGRYEVKDFRILRAA